MAVSNVPVNDAPLIDPEFARVFRRSAFMYLGLGGIIVLFGLAIVAKSLFGPAEGASEEILKYGGGLVASGSLLPIRMGWQRLERITSLGVLVARWNQVAQAGDPNKEIPELRRLYLRLISESLGAKEPA
jgi:hypothetical protein